MREAVERAYQELTGEESMFLFSGWGATLTEPERAVVEDRLPSVEHERQWTVAQIKAESLRVLVLAQLKLQTQTYAGVAEAVYQEALRLLQSE